MQRQGNTTPWGIQKITSKLYFENSWTSGRATGRAIKTNVMNTKSGFYDTISQLIKEYKIFETILKRSL